VSDHTICHVEIVAADPATSSRFYGDLFGWKMSAMPVDGSTTYHTFETPAGLGGGFPSIGVDYKPGDVIVYISTDDIDATLARVTELGGRTLLGKTEIPGMGWYAQFADPTGNRLGLYTM